MAGQKELDYSKWAFEDCYLASDSKTDNKTVVLKKSFLDFKT